MKCLRKTEVRRGGPQLLALFVPQGTAIDSVGTALNFPIRAGQEIALKFATQEELPGK